MSGFRRSSSGIGDPGAAQQVVDRRLASAIVLTSVDGTTTVAAGTPPAYPWVDCAESVHTDRSAASGKQGGLSVRVDVHDGSGDLVGYATAVDPIDTALVVTLAAAAGTPSETDFFPLYRLFAHQTQLLHTGR